MSEQTFASSSEDAKVAKLGCMPELHTNSRCLTLKEQGPVRPAARDSREESNHFCSPPVICQFRSCPGHSRPAGYSWIAALPAPPGGIPSKRSCPARGCIRTRGRLRTVGPNATYLPICPIYPILSYPMLPTYLSIDLSIHRSIYQDIYLSIGSIYSHTYICVLVRTPNHNLLKNNIYIYIYIYYISLHTYIMRYIYIYTHIMIYIYI